MSHRRMITTQKYLINTFLQDYLQRIALDRSYFVFPLILNVSSDTFM